MSGGYMALGREAAHADEFGAVFDIHHDYIYNLACVLLRNAQDAEDVTQEVFLRVYKALPRYDAERAGMRTWLTTMLIDATLCVTFYTARLLWAWLSRRSLWTRRPGAHPRTVRCKPRCAWLSVRCWTGCATNTVQCLYSTTTSTCLAPKSPRCSSARKALCTHGCTTRGGQCKPTLKSAAWGRAAR